VESGGAATTTGVVVSLVAATLVGTAVCVRTALAATPPTAATATVPTSSLAMKPDERTPRRAIRRLRPLAPISGLPAE
jgi:hypothetical protein